ncbi:N-acetyltransferase [Actinoplanes sp. NBRC 14428]|uniref:N-acetylglutamate synthase-like GNAT family acetyltransferase n=1 Tax=Pseudosporangium ferrugineum TaxID=439699 RepID=A0A2T0SD13_9ACTN|nr:GNAT family N-acetyltransferase [Pseudosporangium ferrugineum]PRY31213.1 N-acetylglutamate synthase-like GNAT family acetyltransferase [Pseudosporangium ferrugineum]BCJ54658.1 N-acetyltransferase [Actinoplanes sp. NBRC 14428]
MEQITIRESRFDDPAVQALIALTMAELSARYGGSGDDTPVAAADFAPPTGAFLVAEGPDGRLIGCAGWRAHGSDAELKRMFTIEAARGKGVARRVLAAIEDSARERGYKRVILETGDKQPEAIALYEKCGYERIEDFGYYKGQPGVLSYARVL